MQAKLVKISDTKTIHQSKIDKKQKAEMSVSIVLLIVNKFLKKFTQLLGI